MCLGKALATHSRVLAWRIPGTREPGGLPSMGSQTRLKWLSSSSSIYMWQKTCIENTQNSHSSIKSLKHSHPRQFKNWPKIWTDISSKKQEWSVSIHPQSLQKAAVTYYCLPSSMAKIKRLPTPRINVNMRKHSLQVCKNGLENPWAASYQVSRYLDPLILCRCIYPSEMKAPVHTELVS